MIVKKLIIILILIITHLSLAHAEVDYEHYLTGETPHAGDLVKHVFDNRIYIVLEFNGEDSVTVQDYMQLNMITALSNRFLLIERKLPLGNEKGK